MIYPDEPGHMTSPLCAYFIRIVQITHKKLKPCPVGKPNADNETYVLLHASHLAGIHFELF